jgi:hypothetical protein
MSTLINHPAEVVTAVREVLSAWGLRHYASRFLSCTDGIALVAHLCNAGAKFIDDTLYDLKPLLVQYAAELHPFSWSRDGVVYIETVCGQVSFHIFEDEDMYLSTRCELSGPWAGGFMQDIARELAEEFLGIGDDRDTYRFERTLSQVQPVR